MRGRLEPINLSRKTGASRGGRSSVTGIHSGSLSIAKISASGSKLPFSKWRRKFGCFSERVLLGPRNFSSAQNVGTRLPASFRSSDEHGLDRTAGDWRVLTVRDTPYKRTKGGHHVGTGGDYACAPTTGGRVNLKVSARPQQPVAHQQRPHASMRCQPIAT